MQIIYLDISNRGVVPTIYAKQGDVGRKFQVVLTDSGVPYVPTSGSAFSVWYSGASGEGNYTDIGNKSAFSIDGNKVTVEMIAQMLSNEGAGIISLSLNSPNGNQISTWNIPYICEFVPGIDSEEAENYYTAFSNAVQNLPYPDASLSVAGKAADAAATGVALNGKAPAGYGLGGTATWIPEADTLKGYNANGWYYWSASNGDVDKPFGAGSMFVIRRSLSYWTQIAFEDGSYAGGICVRKIIEGNAQPWDWVNPPMTLGVEYRTTERWNGKVVYTIAVNFGSLPNNVIKQVNAKTNATCVLDIAGYAKNGDEYNPIMMGISGALGTYPYALCNNNSLLVGVRSMKDLSMYVGYFIVKYTKD